jgi:hypothetical protein
MGEVPNFSKNKPPILQTIQSLTISLLRMAIPDYGEIDSKKYQLDFRIFNIHTHAGELCVRQKRNRCRIAIYVKRADMVFLLPQGI